MAIDKRPFTAFHRGSAAWQGEFLQGMLHAEALPEDETYFFQSKAKMAVFRSAVEPFSLAFEALAKDTRPQLLR